MLEYFNFGWGSFKQNLLATAISTILFVLCYILSMFSVLSAATVFVIGIFVILSIKWEKVLGLVIEDFGETYTEMDDETKRRYNLYKNTESGCQCY